MEDNKNLDIDTNINNKNKEFNTVDSAKEDTTNKDIATDNKETTKEKTKTFTQSELDKIIKKRLDRELKKAKEEKEEAERLAKMGVEERAKAELEIEKQKFEQERKSFQKQQLELQVVKELSNKNLPTDFSKYLIGKDAKTCMENIKTFEAEWQQSIEKAINEKLKGNTPKAGNNNVNNNSTNNFMDIIKQNQAKR